MILVNDKTKYLTVLNTSASDHFQATFKNNLLKETVKKETSRIYGILHDKGNATVSVSAHFITPESIKVDFTIDSCDDDTLLQKIKNELHL